MAGVLWRGLEHPVYCLRPCLNASPRRTLPNRRPHRSATHTRVRAPRPVTHLPETPGVDHAVVRDETVGSLGLLLSRSLQSVLVWVGTPPSERAALASQAAYAGRMMELFDAQPPKELSEACEILAEVLTCPGSVQVDQVAGACVAAANWARDAGKSQTRLAFLSAAALCCPFNASLALLVGREARDQALHGHAERWLGRAITVARQGGEWELYVRGHVAYGNMMIARGAFPAARRHLRRAERRSSRHGLQEVRAMALHDLFVVAAECGELTDAHRAAREAIQAYGAGHPRLVNLAFDLAFVWMREGYFESALPVFRSLLPRVEPPFLPHIHGAIARAAGACGQSVDFRLAVRALDRLPVGPGSAEAWVDAANGAISLRKWDAADRHTRLALSLARERRERKVEMLAESLLEAIQQRRAAGSARAVQIDPEISELAFDVAAQLSDCPAGSAA